VRKAVELAIKQQSAPDRLSRWDAFKGGLANNVAPTMGALGGAIATGIEHLRGDENPPTIEENARAFRQRLVEGATGKPPEEQAAYLAELRRAHPMAYMGGAIGGSIADPVGAALQAGGAAATAGRGLLTRAVATGAPSGAIQAAGEGGNPLTGAALGTAGAVGGELVGAAAGKLAGGAAGAPARVAARDLDSEARAAAHELGKADFRADPRWLRTYNHLAAKAPKGGAVEFGPGGRPVQKDIARATDRAMHEAMSGHVEGAPSPGAIGHPYAALWNPNSTPLEKAGAAMHAMGERGEGGLKRAAMLLAQGQIKKIPGAIDAKIAPLVKTIRLGDPAKFQDAIHDALAAGVSMDMISAARDAYARRNHGGRR
jgi:hypothetical protein